MSRIAPSDSDTEIGGFTLIEALIALVVVAVTLSSIGSLFFSNLKSARTLDQHLALLAVARSVESGLPDASNIEPGRTEGEMDGRRWSIEIRPFRGVPLARSSQWIPEHVVVTVTDADGDHFSIDTIRLGQGR